MKQFTQYMFQHVPFLNPHVINLDKILEDWKQYKLSVPTYGAILISENLKNVLLVQSYFAKSSWGFPKGKINENEDPMHCAIREVYEETGFNIQHLIRANDYIELVINFQYTRLYLITGVPSDTKFEPKTRNEIKCCEWFLVEHLPTHKYQIEAKANLGLGPNSFFMILPFIKQLKRWLKEFQTRKDKIQEEKRAKTPKSTTRKNRITPTIAHSIASSSNTGATSTAFFTDNQKSSGKDIRRPRMKSTSEVEGFKLANFDMPEQNQPAIPCVYGNAFKPFQPISIAKEPRRRLVFDNNFESIEKILDNTIKIKPYILQAEKIKVWTDFKFDRRRLSEALNL